ncbi:MAG: bacteriohemerythrin [Bryobacteraceae bacterium]|jgi:hemerythrin
MFEWKPEYSVKISEIDDQHRHLFALAEELHAAMANGRAKAVLEQLLAALVDYTKAHFTAEERLMSQYRYPHAAEHKAEHDKLTTQVLTLQRKFRAGESTLSISLMVFLKNWLEHHIAGSDQQYSAYIRPKLAA